MSRFRFLQQHNADSTSNLALQREEEEIERESARIRHELEMERQRALASPHPTPPFNPQRAALLRSATASPNTSLLATPRQSARDSSPNKSSIVASLNPVFPVSET